MWTRKGLKTVAKDRFKANYWKAVLVALILVVAGGGASGGFSSGISSASTSSLAGIRGEDFAQSQFMPGLLVALAAGGLFFLALAIAFDAFVFNPLEVGARKFFFQNLKGPAQLRELAYGFDHNYLNVVRIMFLRDLYTILWSLLLIVPGIMKSYEYRMIPYLLSEDPDMTTLEAFVRSKEMMDGNKWKAFVLDLSFIGWMILSAVTFGIVGFFYVQPYVEQTDAALYDALRVEKLGQRAAAGSAQAAEENLFDY